MKYCEKCLAKNGNFDFCVMTLQTSCGAFRRRKRVTLQMSCGAKMVEGHTSTIYQALVLRVLEVPPSKALSMLLGNFECSYPPREVHLPGWSITLVLHSLRRS